MAGISEDNSVRYLDTQSAYDAWSAVYDTDGNFLQALDSIEMKALLPRVLSKIITKKPWRIVDLGCGTGRNTLALLNVSDIEVIATDFSQGMLQIARKRLLEEAERLNRSSEIHFEMFDMLSGVEIPKTTRNTDVVISTLVVEHLPLDVFFSTAARMLKPNGLLLVTNMHSQMGEISQAGFVDPQTQQKIRPTSYAHTVPDTVAEARRHGLEVVDQINERAIDADLALKLGSRATKWIGITVWFGGIFRKTT